MTDKKTVVVPPDAKFVTAKQVIEGGRWPIARTQFYDLVNSKHITKRRATPDSLPVYSVEEIDSLFAAPRD